MAPIAAGALGAGFVVVLGLTLTIVVRRRSRELQAVSVVGQGAADRATASTPGERVARLVGDIEGVLELVRSDRVRAESAEIARALGLAESLLERALDRFYRVEAPSGDGSVADALHIVPASRPRPPSVPQRAGLR